MFTKDISGAHHNTHFFPPPEQEVRRTARQAKSKAAAWGQIRTVANTDWGPGGLIEENNPPPPDGLVGLL